MHNNEEHSTAGPTDVVGQGGVQSSEASEAQHFSFDAPVGAGHDRVAAHVTLVDAAGKERKLGLTARDIDAISAAISLARQYALDTGAQVGLSAAGNDTTRTATDWLVDALVGFSAAVSAGEQESSDDAFIAFASGSAGQAGVHDMLHRLVQYGYYLHAAGLPADKLAKFPNLDYDEFLEREVSKAEAEAKADELRATPGLGVIAA